MNSGTLASSQGVAFMKNWLFLGVAIFAEVIATSALKASDSFTNTTASVLVIAGYATAFYFLSLTLRTIPVGIAYAVWSGLGILLVSGVAWFLYDQRLDTWGFVGIALIIGGVLVLNLLSRATAH